MIVFSIDTKKNKFLGLILKLKLKIPFFPVQIFVVKSIKQFKNILSLRKMLKKYATSGGGLQCDPSQWG